MINRLLIAPPVPTDLRGIRNVSLLVGNYTIWVHPDIETHANLVLRGNSFRVSRTGSGIREDVVGEGGSLQLENSSIIYATRGGTGRDATIPIGSKFDNTVIRAEEPTSSHVDLSFRRSGIHRNNRVVDVEHINIGTIINPDPNEEEYARRFRSILYIRR